MQLFLIRRLTKGVLQIMDNKAMHAWVEACVSCLGANLFATTRAGFCSHKQSTHRRQSPVGCYAPEYQSREDNRGTAQPWACACVLKLEDARRELEQLLPSLPAQDKPGSLLATLVRHRECARCLLASPVIFTFL